MGSYIANRHVRMVLRNNIDFNGEKMQAIVAMEEMSELTKEICKHFRGKKNIISIAEEIADVEIMLEQLKMIFKCEEIVADKTEEKIGRIYENLEKAGALRKMRQTGE